MHGKNDSGCFAGDRAREGPITHVLKCTFDFQDAAGGVVQKTILQPPGSQPAHQIP